MALLPQTFTGGQLRDTVNAAGPLSPPTGFPFRFDLCPLTISALPGGYHVTVNPRGLIPAGVWSAQPYHVMVGGNDNLSGLGAYEGDFTNALGTIKKAVELANAANVPARIIVKAGDYRRDRSMGGTGNIVPTVDIAFIAWGGRVVTGPWDDLTYTSVGGGVYSAARSNVLRVFDIATVDANGDYAELTKVTDQATCAATPGSWAQVSSTLYVNRLDGAVVTNANTRALILANGAYFNATSKAVYMEGIDVEGGSAGGIYATSTTGNFVAVNCTSKYAGTVGTPVDQFRMLNISGVVLLKDCVGARGRKDALNFTRDSGTARTMFVLTIDCVGRDCGSADTNSCNGWTLHQDIVGIDIGGRYNNCRGGTVRNINQTRAWMVGATIYGDTSDGDISATEVRLDNSAMIWLERCDIEATTNALSATDTTSIFTRDCTIDGAQVTSGSGVIAAF